MNRHVVVCGAALLLLLTGGVTWPALNEQPEADAILAEARMRLPDQAFAVQGNLLTAGFHQFPERVAAFEADIDFAGRPMVADYVLRDRFGTAVQQLTVIRPQNDQPEFIFEALTDAESPRSLNERIAGTDLTWSDLSLAFLWWRGGVTVGRARILGRECHVLEYPLVARDASEGAAVSARLWVDVNMLVLLQVEERNAAGERVRRVQIKDLKKIGGLWMVKNMEARNYLSRTRTLIQVSSASTASDELEPDAAEAAGDAGAASVVLPGNEQQSKE